MATQTAEPHDGTADDHPARLNRVPPELRKMAIQTGAEKARRSHSGTFMVVEYDSCVPTTFTAPIQRGDRFRVCNIHAGEGDRMKVHIKET
jgi:hypothetical protein